MRVRVSDLVKRFGETVAVDGLTATFESGELVALLGPSGCGKSTMLNMLSGILPVTQGKIYFDDEDVTDLSPDKRGVGLVFQNYALYPHMTVLENVCFPLAIQRIPKKERIERAMEFVQMVHIEELLDRRPGELSGGQQQRVAIARALIKSPRLLLLDEPLSNLDAKLRVEMREEIRRIQRKSGVTTIFVTHDQEEASSIADRIMLLRRGVMQQYGTVRELYGDPANLFVADFLGAPTINQLRGVWTDAGFSVGGSGPVIPFGAPAVQPGAACVFAARAEALTVNAPGGCFDATVADCYTAGKDMLLLLDVAGQSMRAYIDAAAAPANGQTVRVGLRDAGVFLFDAETGARYA
ncbi:MAG: ABC transporter ATP-binding protein [Oscillospiraceae bacterium]|nr:ABC transporter ATP-binding protein [Oscillospiraceae bacterium]